MSSDEDEVEEEKVTPPPTLALKASDRLDEKHPFLFGKEVYLNILMHERHLRS